jgi:hypothetical protein
VDKIETVDEVNEENNDNEPEDAAPPAPAKPGGLFSNPKRNLTNEAIVANLEAKKAEEVAKVPADEVVKLALPKLDKNGNKVKDGNGFTVIEERTVLKRDKVSADWDKRIAEVTQNLQG